MEKKVIWFLVLLVSINLAYAECPIIDQHGNENWNCDINENFGDLTAEQLQNLDENKLNQIDPESFNSNPNQLAQLKPDQLNKYNKLNELNKEALMQKGPDGKPVIAKIENLEKLKTNGKLSPASVEALKEAGINVDENSNMEDCKVKEGEKEDNNKLECEGKEYDINSKFSREADGSIIIYGELGDYKSETKFVGDGNIKQNDDGTFETSDGDWEITFKDSNGNENKFNGNGIAKLYGDGSGDFDGKWDLEFTDDAGMGMGSNNKYKVSGEGKFSFTGAKIIAEKGDWTINIKNDFNEYTFKGLGELSHRSDGSFRGIGKWDLTLNGEDFKISSSGDEPEFDVSPYGVHIKTGDITTPDGQIITGAENGFYLSERGEGFLKDIIENNKNPDGTINYDKVRKALSDIMIGGDIGFDVGSTGWKGALFDLLNEEVDNFEKGVPFEQETLPDGNTVDPNDPNIVYGPPGEIAYGELQNIIGQDVLNNLHTSDGIAELEKIIEQKWDEIIKAMENSYPQKDNPELYNPDGTMNLGDLQMKIGGEISALTQMNENELSNEEIDKRMKYHEILWDVTEDKIQEQETLEQEGSEEELNPNTEQPSNIPQQIELNNNQLEQLVLGYDLNTGLSQITYTDEELSSNEESPMTISGSDFLDILSNDYDKNNVEEESSRLGLEVKSIGDLRDILKYEFSLKEGDILVFYFPDKNGNSVKHTYQLNYVPDDSPNYVTTTIASDPLRFNLMILDSIKIDLNTDGVEDLLIKLLSVDTIYSATFEFILLTPNMLLDTVGISTYGYVVDYEDEQGNKIHLGENILLGGALMGTYALELDDRNDLFFERVKNFTVFKNASFAKEAEKVLDKHGNEFLMVEEFEYVYNDDYTTTIRVENASEITVDGETFKQIQDSEIILDSLTGDIIAAKIESAIDNNSLTINYPLDPSKTIYISDLDANEAVVWDSRDVPFAVKVRGSVSVGFIPIAKFESNGLFGMLEIQEYSDHITYRIRNGNLTIDTLDIGFDEYIRTDNFEDWNTIEVYYQSGVRCMNLSPETYYEYKSDIMNESFMVYVPIELDSYKLCLKKDPMHDPKDMFTDPSSNKIGYIDLLENMFYLASSVDYYQPYYDHYELMTVYDGKDLNNKLAFSKSNGFSINNMTIINYYPTLGALSVTKTSHFSIVETFLADNLQRYLKMEYTMNPRVLGKYTSYYHPSVITVKDWTLLQESINDEGGLTKVTVFTKNSELQTEFIENIIVKEAEENFFDKLMKGFT